MDDTAHHVFDGESWVALLGKFFVSDTMTYESLIVDANAHLFLKDAKAKSYKLVKTPDGLIKLIAYFKS
jgi:hypothetical protein